jgi:hypothetical protein
MTPAGSTTISDVTILPKNRHQRRGDTFDIILSPDGIEIMRPGRRQQHLSWDRIARWEIAEHVGYVVLTLRGDGAVTPLVVRGWTLDDLELVMRDVTSDAAGSIPVHDMPSPPGSSPPGSSPPGSPSPAASPVTAGPVAEAVAVAVAEETAVESDISIAAPPVDPPARSRRPESRVARRRRLQRNRRKARFGWKAAVTVVLLVALAAAVTIVLLQSAGAISWGFLGPS